MALSAAGLPSLGAVDRLSRVVDADRAFAQHHQRGTGFRAVFFILHLRLAPNPFGYPIIATIRAIARFRGWLTDYGGWVCLHIVAPYAFVLAPPWREVVPLSRSAGVTIPANGLDDRNRCPSSDSSMSMSRNFSQGSPSMRFRHSSCARGRSPWTRRWRRRAGAAIAPARSGCARPPPR